MICFLTLQSQKAMPNTGIIVRDHCRPANDFGGGLRLLNVEFITEYVEEGTGKSRFSFNQESGIIFLVWKAKCDVMDILLIVLSLVAAYVLFVTVCYLLIRLLFPKIEVDDSEEARPVRSRVNRYASRAERKQKNLAY
jgi:hypothetical protein